MIITWPNSIAAHNPKQSTTRSRFEATVKALTEIFRSGRALRAFRSGNEFLGDDGQIKHIDHAILIDVGSGIEAGLASPRPKRSFHQVDIDTVDIAVAVDVALHLRDVCGRFGNGLDLHITGVVPADAVEAVAVGEVTDKPCSRLGQR